MKQAVVTLYKWDANLQRSIPVEVKTEEVVEEIFTSDEMLAIARAVLGFDKPNKIK